MELLQGDMLAIMGESGSGKSTLLKIIGAMDFAWQGGVSVCGKNLSGLSEGEAADFRAQKIGFLFQNHFFLPQFTLLENVLMPTLATKKNAKDYAEKLLKKLSVYELKNRFQSEVSGGELQRAALARALINSPELLIADEPTGALDEKNSAQLLELLKELNKETKLSIVLATHSQKLASRLGCTKFMSDKKLV